MKITRDVPFTRPRVSLTSVASGGSAGTGLVSNGSNSSTEWVPIVQSITAGGAPVLGPFVNLAAGSNIALTIDTFPASASSNTVRIHATGGAASFGSNATHVAEISAGGAATDSARMDHLHAGIGTITASSSNTLQRGTVNIRPGAGIALSLTDTDGDGEFDTATIVNTGVPGPAGSSTFIGARVYHNANQSTTSTVILALAMNSERYDTNGFHDTVTNNSRLTVPTGLGGYYLVTGHVEWAANAAGYRNLFIQVGGATVIAVEQVEESDSASISVRQSLSTVYLLAAGDYVELMVQQNSGGALNVNATGNFSPEFSISRLGPA